MLPCAEQIRKLVITISILMVLLFCLLPVFYFGVYRMADYIVCRSLVGLRLGKGTSLISIEEYIKESLTPGLGREEVKSKLDEIGRVEIIPSRGGTMNISSEQANLSPCTHPLNTITLFINYSPEGKLTSIKFLDD